MKSVLIIFCILILGIFHLKSQTYFPENGELYIDTIVPRIDITVDPDTLAWIYEWENLESDIEFTASFVYDNRNMMNAV